MADEPNIKTHRYYSKNQHAKLAKSMETKTLLLAGGISLIDAAGGGGTVLSTGDLLRGSDYTFETEPLVVGGVGSYSASGLPLGMTINTTTGVVTGRPLSWSPRKTCTITRGVETADVEIGVTARVGVRAPQWDVPNYDPDAITALGLWTTTQTPATKAALDTAINTAQADRGTAAAPKFHRITYTGPEIVGDIIPGDTGTAHTPAVDCVIYMDGQNATVTQRIFADSGNNRCMIFANWKVLNSTGDANGALQIRSFSNGGFRACKAGQWWQPGTFTDFDNDDDYTNPSSGDHDDIYTGSGAQVLSGRGYFEACHFAGVRSGIATREVHMYSVDNFFSHFSVDIFAIGAQQNTTIAADSSIWEVDTTADRMAFGRDVYHTDYFQHQTTPTAAGLLQNWVYSDGAVYFGANPNYGSTGFRDADWRPSGANQKLTLEAHNAFMAVSGFDGAVIYENDSTLENLFVVPAPGVGADGARIVYYDDVTGQPLPGTTVLNNIWTSAVSLERGWIGSGLVATGSVTDYNIGDNLPAIMPNLTAVSGTVLSKPTQYIVTDLPRALHPKATRDFANTYRPSAGWSPFRDPTATTALSDLWGAAPSLSSPTLTLTDFDIVGGTSGVISATTGTSSGVFWFVVSTSATTPSAVFLMSQANSTQEFETAQPREWGVSRFSGGVIPDITLTGSRFTAGVTYYVHAMVEADDGALSTVQTTSVVAASSYTPRGAAFDGATGFRQTTGLSFTPSSSGAISFWFRNRDSAWNTISAGRFFETRNSFTPNFEFFTAPSGLMQLRVSNNTATDLLSVRESIGPNVSFSLNQWYHVCADWSGSRVNVYVDGVLNASITGITSFDMAASAITQFALGCNVGGTVFPIGDMASVWIAFNQTLDFSVATNYEKFVLAGQPVDLGSDGSLPTGTAPEIFFEWDAGGSTFTQRGSLSMTLITPGAVTVSVGAPSY
jgi:hypothetical protein